MWTTLAQATNNRLKQLAAYQKAVESLESIPLAQVEYLILYGEFLYSSGYPVEDAKNQVRFETHVRCKYSSINRRGAAAKSGTGLDGLLFKEGPCLFYSISRGFLEVQPPRHSCSRRSA